MAQPESLTQTESDPICNSHGCTQYLFPKDKSSDYPKDYFVPNFGIDRPDVAVTFNSLEVAEAMRQHRWEFTGYPKPGPEATKYDTAPKLDEDIITTQEHEKLAKEKFMVKDKKSKKSDKKDSKKKGKSAKKSSKKDDDKKKDDAKIQLEADTVSDPICHSAGCTQYRFPKPPKKNEYPMDYFVPHFGRDSDIITTFNSLDVAESIRRHRWDLDPDYKKKPDPPVLYNFKEELDDDIEMTNEHMEEAEKKLKHKWVYNALQLEADEKTYTDNEIKELLRQHHEISPKYNNPIALAHLTSDPIFGSGETPLDEHKYADGMRKIIQYPDPDEQGLDADILGTQKNLLSSEKYWRHTWKYNTSANMPNFAIPGKPQYDGENRTNVRTYGKWHIPFTTDGRMEVTPAVQAQKNSPANTANASNQTTTAQQMASSAVKTAIETKKVSQLVAPAVNKTENKTQSLTASQQKAEMRKKL